MKFCPQCEKANMDNAKKCVLCGADMNTPLDKTSNSSSSQQISLSKNESSTPSNIGEKIKTMSQVLAVLSFILVGVCCIVGMVYLSSSSSKDTTFGLVMLVSGIVFGILVYVSYLSLCGFGRLVETNEQILLKLSQIEKNTHPADKQ